MAELKKLVANQLAVVLGEQPKMTNKSFQIIKTGEGKYKLEMSVEFECKKEFKSNPQTPQVNEIDPGDGALAVLNVGAAPASTLFDPTIKVVAVRENIHIEMSMQVGDGLLIKRQDMN